MSYMEKYHSWLEDEFIDEKTKKELLEIKDDKKEIEDRFYKELEFGTGGLRGIIGAGSNRMNIYTLGAATQGFANYISKLGPEMKAKGVAIAYDSRHYSREFAQEIALVLNGNGIKTHLFRELKTTPELSFAVRYLGCIGGIVVTASHNPSQYNGYKVYSSAGMQLGLEASEQVIQEAKEIVDFSDIRKKNMEDAVKEGLFTMIGKEVEDAFIQTVKTQSLHREVVERVSSDFRIIYTPLHGTGNKPVQRILKELGFENVFVVPEQAKPDGDFPTVMYPNPEERAAYTLALELAVEKNAQVIIATDPDGDRMGVVFKNKNGEYILLNGNQTGALLTEYVLSSQKEKGILPENGAVIKTIVTSELGAKIAQSYGVEVFNTLTGFKFIGELMEEFSLNDEYQFILGYEESYGYLIGNHARDKDGVVASMLVAEMTAYYYDKGLSLDEVLENMYREYGYYLEKLRSITLEGKDGMEQIQKILSYFRKECPLEWQGQSILYIEDYLAQKKYDKERKVIATLGLPKSNVLKFILGDGSWFCIRPSGTEPKIKFYFSVLGESIGHTKRKCDGLIKEVMGLVKSM